MNKKIKYKIVIDHSLILETYRGAIKLPDVEFHLKNEFRDKWFNPFFDYICDLRGAEIILTPQEIQQMTSFLESVRSSVMPHKCALITETPAQVASATIYSDLLKSFPVDCDVFTTIKAAITWLNKPAETESIIKDFISES